MPVSDPVEVWLIGGPTAVLELGGVRLLIDPTFSVGETMPAVLERMRASVARCA